MNVFDVSKHIVEGARKPTRKYVEQQRKLGRALDDIAKEAAKEKEPAKPPRKR